MWDPNASTSSPSATTSGSNTNARYAYLTGRLRARQITMEEATELFGLMQGMLQRSEAGRQALMAASRSRGSTGVTAPSAAPAPRSASPVGSSDDLLMFGLLAMGAGSGLVAALSKRIQEGPRPATPPSREPSSTVSPE